MFRVKFRHGVVARHVAPELFQLVTVARLVRHDVDQQESVVHDDPLALRRAVDCDRMDAELFAHGTLDAFRDGADVRFGEAGADQIVVADRAVLFSHIKPENVFGLVIVGFLFAQFDHVRHFEIHSRFLSFLFIVHVVILRFFEDRVCVL